MSAKFSERFWKRRVGDDRGRDKGLNLAPPCGRFSAAFRPHENHPPSQVSRTHDSAAKAGALQTLRAIRCQKKSHVLWLSIPPATRPPVAPGLFGRMWMQANCPNRSRFVAVPGLPEFGCLQNGKPHTGKGAEK